MHHEYWLKSGQSGIYTIFDIIPSFLPFLFSTISIRVFFLNSHSHFRILFSSAPALTFCSIILFAASNVICWLLESFVRPYPFGSHMA